jgi:hypothetical protein
MSAELMRDRLFKPFQTHQIPMPVFLVAPTKPLNEPIMEVVYCALTLHQQRGLLQR